MRSEKHIHPPPSYFIAKRHLTRPCVAYHDTLGGVYLTCNEVALSLDGSAVYLTSPIGDISRRILAPQITVRLSAECIPLCGILRHSSCPTDE